MKKTSIINALVILSLTTSVFANVLPETKVTTLTTLASDKGIYLGLQGGLGMTNWQNTEEIKSTFDNIFTVAESAHGTNGFASRIFAGYDINKYFAIEGGFSYFFSQAYLSGTENAVPVNSPDIQTRAFDLLGKGKVPIADKFDLYAKLGANVLMHYWPKWCNTVNVNVTFGAGIDYHITSNVSANFEWLRFNGHDRIVDADKYQPSTDMFMLGLRYKFDV